MTDFNVDLVRTIQNKSISSIICDQLEEMILSGKIKSGERINESQLSKILGVSRAPIREACRQLERSGMVEVRNNKGTFVKQIDLREVEELYEIRAALDALAGEKAALAITDEQQGVLYGLLEEMQLATEKEDPQQYYKTNLDFHMCIMRIAGNSSLIHIYEGICKKASLFRQTSLSIPGRLPESLDHHRLIYEAIISKDSAKAARLMKDHIMEAKDALVKYCASKNSEINA